jgi:deoxyuridine 5'-triphosphate nucleotidohydrolase
MFQNLLVKKLDPAAIAPTCAHPGKDLGYDLYALEDTILWHGAVTRVRTGVACVMLGYGFRIADRSSMAMQNVRVSGGVIDHYTGEMFANLTYTPATDMFSSFFKIRRGDKIAQFIPQRIETSDPILLVEELPESERGPAGYGSTGR